MLQSMIAAYECQLCMTVEFVATDIFVTDICCDQCLWCMNVCCDQCLLYTYICLLDCCTYICLLHMNVEFVATDNC